jgi:hypothetical protein
MKTIGKKLTPADATQPDADTTLGSLSDASAPAIEPAEPIKTSRKKPVTVAAEDAPLTLPKGALVVMRRSGGFRFTSSQVTVQRDGRIARTTTDVTARSVKGKTKAPKLTAKQVSGLRVTLAKSGLDQVEKRIASQPPDGYAYEIVARVGRKVHSVEVFDGSIPAELAPLIKQLSGYLQG